MPLPEVVSEIYANMAQVRFSDSLKRFCVDDVGTNRNDLRVVLLVESPHTHEVGYKIPLVGDAGKHVRDVLNESRQEGVPEGPVGRLVNDQHPFPSVPRLGIMNVSQLPFKRDAYDLLPWENDDCRHHTCWCNFIAHMNIIKGDPGASSRSSDMCRSLHEAISSDLRRRLTHLACGRDDVLLVRCGDVAQKFADSANANLCYCDLPHPSRKAWSHKKRQHWTDEQTQCLCSILGRVFDN